MVTSTIIINEIIQSYTIVIFCNNIFYFIICFFTTIISLKFKNFMYLSTCLCYKTIKKRRNNLEILIFFVHAHLQSYKTDFMYPFFCYRAIKSWQDQILIYYQDGLRM